MVKLSAFADEAGGSLAEQIAALKENGLNRIDIRNIDGVGVLNISMQDAKTYKRELDGAGIRVSCIGSPLGKSDPCGFDDFKKDLDRILDLAKVFETDKVRMFSFYHFEGHEQEIFDCLSQAARYAQLRGVYLYHENERGIYGEAPEQCLELIEKTGCRCIFDPANFVLFGHKIENAEKLLLSHSDFYHVKDGRYTGEIVPAGKGDGNLEKLLARDGVTLTVEPHLYFFGGIENLTKIGLKPSEFVFGDPRSAFDAGVRAVQEILKRNKIQYE